MTWVSEDYFFWPIVYYNLLPVNNWVIFTGVPIFCLMWDRSLCLIICNFFKYIRRLSCMNRWCCQVNLRYGVKHEFSRTGQEKDTCTACAGTMILEFSALSRLTGNKIYEVCFNIVFHSVKNCSEDLPRFILILCFHENAQIESQRTKEMGKW